MLIEALAGERLRPLRPGPLPREAGPRARGERPLQACQLAPPALEPVSRAHSRPRPGLGSREHEGRLASV